MNTIKIPAKQARIKFGELLERARWGDVRFLITKKDRPLGYLSGLQEAKKKKDKMSKPFPFKGRPLGAFKTPLTREYMYDQRLDRTLGH